MVRQIPEEEYRMPGVSSPLPGALGFSNSNRQYQIEVNSASCSLARFFTLWSRI